MGLQTVHTTKSVSLFVQNRSLRRLARCSLSLWVHIALHPSRYILWFVFTLLWRLQKAAGMAPPQLHTTQRKGWDVPTPAEACVCA